jgi:hypothetical protein
MLSKDALDGGHGDSVPFCDLAQAQTLAAVTLNGGIVQLQRIPAYVLAFEARAPHSGAHPLDD